MGGGYGGTGLPPSATAVRSAITIDTLGGPTGGGYGGTGLPPSATAVRSAITIDTLGGPTGGGYGGTGLPPSATAVRSAITIDTLGGPTGGGYGGTGLPPSALSVGVFVGIVWDECRGPGVSETARDPSKNKMEIFLAIMCCLLEIFIDGVTSRLQANDGYTGG